MRSFCLLASMELIPTPNSSKSLFLIKKESIAINIIVGSIGTQDSRTHTF